MQHPTVQLRLHERSMRDQYSLLKKKEQSLDKRFEELKAREDKVLAREAALADRELKASKL